MEHIYSLVCSFLVTLLLVSTSYGADEAPKAGGTATTTTAPTAEAPKLTGEGEKIWNQMKDLFEASKVVNSTKPSEKAKARAQIESALDWDKVAADCLGKANMKKAGAKFGTFRNLLKEVMLKTAFSRMDKFWDGATYKLANLDLKGNSGIAKAQFDVKGEPMFLEYFWNKKGKWLIHDISYEDMRYSVNINEQLDSFLKENNFNALIEKLKKRSAELDSDKGADKADAKKKG
jgi:ABC-type transporter MlaC component